MHYYPHNIADFNNATRHLTRVERSVYRDAIERYYDTEQPLPADDFDRLARLLLCRNAEEKEALAAILSDFFELDGNVYRNTRCDLEIQKYRDNNSAKARAGKASAEARRKKAEQKKAAKEQQKETPVEHVLNACGTDEQLTNNQEPITNNQEPNINTPQPPKGGAQQITFDSWPTDPSPQVLRDWKKSRKAALTQTAVNRMAKEFHEAATHGYSVDDCLSVCCEAGWRSFKLEWLLNRENDKQRGNVPPQQQAGSNRRTRDMSAIEIATDTSWADDFIPADR